MYPPPVGVQICMVGSFLSETIYCLGPNLLTQKIDALLIGVLKHLKKALPLGRVEFYRPP